ncbi:MAG: hypothetical protein VKO65_03505 [Cyanobacteriota bacterium]|nr:hypothetical protein [Cyanobacteriota bacterium]
MLIPSPSAARPWALLLALLGLTGSGLAGRALAQQGGATGAAGDAPATPERPPGLVILQERTTLEGQQVIGVYGAVADPAMPELRSVRVWDQVRGRVVVATDRVRCSREAPLRITGQGGRVFMRSLNPGGPITAANRLDHLIWWAVCHPELAGRDPAGLAAEARRLGYPGTLPEREEILPGG